MSATQVTLTPEQQAQVRRLAKVAANANKDAGFKYLKLCEPALILAMIGALRHLATVQGSDLDRLEQLARAAAGKRATSDEGFAFIEAAEPGLIHGWCRDILATFDAMRERA